MGRCKTGAVAARATDPRLEDAVRRHDRGRRRIGDLGAQIGLERERGESSFLPVREERKLERKKKIWALAGWAGPRT